MSITDVSDPGQVKSLLKAQKSKDGLAKEGLRATMSSEAGRAWLYRALLWCDPFRSAFATDASVMAMRCGEINIGLQLIADMDEVSPELYLQMMKENK